MCLCEHQVHAGALRHQQRTAPPPVTTEGTGVTGNYELELQAIMWGLEPKLGSLAKAASTLNHEGINFYFFKENHQ